MLDPVLDPVLDPDRGWFSCCQPTADRSLSMNDEINPLGLAMPHDGECDPP